MNPALDFCRIPNWYPRFSPETFPMTFVWLSPEEIQALIRGENGTPAVKKVISRLEEAMADLPAQRFVSVDTAAPVDVPRFKSKRGAVHSAKSAWQMLSSSERVRKAAEKGEVSCICARPFRRMDMQREFRMFIYHGKLKAMSQYWLVRHFPWLEKRQEKYWNIGLKFVEKYGFAFPAEDFVMDVYISSSDHVKVLDLNEFGGKTDPLMMNDWNLDWESMTPGIHIVPPPRMVSGEVNVSF